MSFRGELFFEMFVATKKPPAQSELDDGPLLTPIWRLSTSSGRTFRRRRRLHRGVCVLPPCGVLRDKKKRVRVFFF